MNWWTVATAAVVADELWLFLVPINTSCFLCEHAEFELIWSIPAAVRTHVGCAEQACGLSVAGPSPPCHIVVNQPDVDAEKILWFHILNAKIQKICHQISAEPHLKCTHRVTLTGPGRCSTHGTPKCRYGPTTMPTFFSWSIYFESLN